MIEIAQTTLDTGLPARPAEHARHARRHRPRRVRRRRSHRARRGERDGALPRAPGLQGRREVRDLPRRQQHGRAAGRAAERVHLARRRRLPHHLPRRGADGRRRPADRLRRPRAPGRRRARQASAASSSRRSTARTTSPRASPTSCSTRRSTAITRSAARCSARRSTSRPSRATRSSPSATASGRPSAAARSWPATSRTSTTASWPSCSPASPAGPPTARPTPRPAFERRVLVTERDTNQSHLRLAWEPKIDPTSLRERAALSVYSTLLGGSMGSRLFDEIREQRGLCYAIRAYGWTHADSSTLEVASGLDSTKCLEAYDADQGDRPRARDRRADRGGGRAGARLRRRLDRARARVDQRRRPPRRRQQGHLRRGHLARGRRSTALDAVTYDEVRQVAAGIDGEPAVAVRRAARAVGLRVDTGALTFGKSHPVSHGWPPGTTFCHGSRPRVHRSRLPVRLLGRAGHLAPALALRRRARLGDANGRALRVARGLRRARASPSRSSRTA